jgi:hypothetical protein
MSDTYAVKPINTNCSSQQTNSVIMDTTNPAYQVTDQLEASTKYDNVNNLSIKPLKGGSIKKLTIKFKNKLYHIQNSSNEIQAIKNILNNKIYKRDYLLEILENKSLYIIRGNYKNKFEKIY